MAAADALGATAQPVSSPSMLADTADASVPPALPVSVKIPKGAATSSIVGEVERLEAVTRKKRAPFVIAAAAAVAVVAGIVIANKSHTGTVTSRDAAAMSVSDAAAMVEAVDAAVPIDAGERDRCHDRPGPMHPWAIPDPTQACGPGPSTRRFR